MNIIINGPGRSGTTLLNSLLSYHKDLGWISGWVNKCPSWPSLSFFNFLYRTEVMGVVLSSVSKLPKPTEAYGFWLHYLNEFDDNSMPQEDEVSKLRKAVKKLLNYQNKDHFITKITGDLRLKSLNKVFDNYEIIWIERDPRVVVSSYMKQRWFYKDNLAQFNELSLEDKLIFYAKYYLKNYHNSKQADIKLVFYEDLCANPTKFIENLLENLGLEFTNWHESKIKKHDIQMVDWSHYETNYSQSHVELLNHYLSEPLKDYGYI